MKGLPTGPLFICENCGSPVPRDAKKCPTCGRFFASVRCPSCNFTGPESLFSEGCPICGYSSPAAKSSNRGSAFSDTTRLAHPQKNRGLVTPLPWWIYGLTLAVFVAVLVIALITLTD